MISRFTKKHIFVTCFITVFTCLQTFGLSHFALLQHPTTKKFVLVYGDVCRQKLTKFAVNQIETVLEFLAHKNVSLGKVCIEKNLSTDLLLDAPKMTPEQFAQTHWNPEKKREFYMVPTTYVLYDFYFKRKKMKSTKHLQVFPCDQRERASNIINTVLQNIELSIRITPKAISSPCIPCGMTKQQYLKSIEQHLLQLSQQLKKLKIPKKKTQTKTLCPYKTLGVIEKNYKKIKNQLANFHDNTDMAIIFWKLIKKEVTQNKTQMYRAYNKVEMQYGTLLDHTIGSLYFFIKAFESQTLKDITIFVGGEIHSKRMVKLFKQLGYEEIDSFLMKRKKEPNKHDEIPSYKYFIPQPFMFVMPVVKLITHFDPSLFADLISSFQQKK